MLPKDYADVYEFISYPCVRSLLIVFNILLWFSALFMIWMGVWMQMDFEDYLIFNDLYSDKAPLVLMIAGAIIIFLTSLACSCTVRINPFMMVIYGACLIITLFSLIALSIYISTYKEQLLDALPESISKQIHQCNSHSSAKYMDLIKEQCCDVDIERKALYQVRPAKLYTTSTDSTDMQTRNLDITSTDCYGRLRSTIDTNFSTVTVTLSAMALIPLFGCILSIILFSMHPKSTYEVIA